MLVIFLNNCYVVCVCVCVCVLILSSSHNIATQNLTGIHLESRQLYNYGPFCLTGFNS